MEDRPLIHEGSIELAPGVRALPSGIRLAYSRSSGPGGQNVNKLNTRAEVWVAVNDLRGLDGEALQRLAALAGRRITQSGEIHLSSEEFRSQERNRSAVFDRLRELIVQAKAIPKARKKTRPGRAARQKRLESKKRRSQLKKERGTSEHPNS
ncbi:MAG: alternative ribosome rescue aminoacyl-tRNA hydrolase ArfB [Tepidisphaeraceae bacterium]